MLSLYSDQLPNIHLSKIMCDLGRSKSTSSVLFYQSWTGPEKLLALDELIDSCEPTQVKHMMQVIEPQFQRDFISLLPKEVSPQIPFLLLSIHKLICSHEPEPPWEPLVADIVFGWTYEMDEASSPARVLSLSSFTSFNSICSGCLVFALHRN